MSIFPELKLGMTWSIVNFMEISGPLKRFRTCLTHVES
jgi:hypothetical protein